MTRLEQVRWDHPDLVALCTAQQAELRAIYGADDLGPALTGDDVLAAALLREDDGTPVACGAVRDAAELGVGTGELKRMYVVPSARGRGLSHRLLDALEWAAARCGLTRLVLETGVLQPTAIQLYLSAGYLPISNFPPYDDEPSSRCFAKRLTGTAPVPVSEPVADTPPRVAVQRSSGLMVVPAGWMDHRSVALRRQMAAELADIYGFTAWFADAATLAASDRDHMPSVLTTLLALDRGAPIGAASLSTGHEGWPGDWVELERVFVLPEARGRGVARLLLSVAEDEARALGMSMIVLDTGFLQDQSIALYRSAGYRAIEPYGDWYLRPRLLWFGKTL